MFISQVDEDKQGLTDCSKQFWLLVRRVLLLSHNELQATRDQLDAIHTRRHVLVGLRNTHRTALKTAETLLATSDARSRLLGLQGAALAPSVQQALRAESKGLLEAKRMRENELKEVYE